MQVVIIGSGNVAHVLGRKIKAAGHQVLQVVSRQLPTSLATELGAAATDDFSLLNTQAKVYLLAVSDGAVASVAANLPKLDGIVAHTAGAVPLQELSSARHYGVLYPLQSLRKEKTDYETVPLLVDGSTEMVKDTLLQFAKTLSTQVDMANDSQRLKLHVAAVVVSNFTNHLYALAHHFCQQEAIGFTLLQPLIEEVATRMRYFSPAEMQTGPAARGDEATIYNHLQLLEKHPQLQHIYQVLTQSIQTSMKIE